ncbi:ANTAR domain-containing protein, partial [Modestobacter altitudinis]|uniref:ANTAR domain-containing protein n=1 Tax=Modestobacter altitudinis TaxID=2213158 RepID=UPI001FE4B3A3
MEQPAAVVPAVLPHDVVRTPSGQPAALVVRSGRGWTVLSPEEDGAWADVSGRVAGAGEALSLVEAMSLADLVAAEHGSSPEPGRDARRAARTVPGAADDAAAAPADPRDEELAALRRTIGQLEHALAARVSIERAIGVLAERHGTTPREAFEALRRNARSQGRAAQELATEVLDGLPAAHPAGP